MQRGGFALTVRRRTMRDSVRRHVIGQGRAIILLKPALRPIREMVPDLYFRRSFARDETRALAGIVLLTRSLREVRRGDEYAGE